MGQIIDVIQRFLLVILGAIALTSPAWSQSAKKPSLEENKAAMLGRIDQNIKDMQQHRACIEAATNPAGLRVCKSSMRQKHKAKRAESRGRRNNRRERLDIRTGPGTLDTGETPAETPTGP